MHRTAQEREVASGDLCHSGSGNGVRLSLQSPRLAAQIAISRMLAIGTPNRMSRIRS